MRTLGPSLGAAAVCLPAPGEKEGLELQGGVKALLRVHGVIAGQGEKEQKSKPGSSQCLLCGLLAKIYHKTEPTEQTDKKPPVVLFLVVKRNPVFSEDLCESGVCGVWPHHPELLLGALA